MRCLPESDDPLTTRFFGTLMRLMKSSQQEAMQIASEHDLAFSHVRILFTLEWAPAPLAVGELANEIGLSVAATGRAVDALHRSNIVTRHEDPDDRRVKRIALSDHGVEIVRSIAQARLTAAEQFVSALDDGERAQFAGAVATLETLVERHVDNVFPTTPSNRSEQPA